MLPKANKVCRKMPPHWGRNWTRRAENWKCRVHLVQASTWRPWYSMARLLWALPVWAMACTWTRPIPMRHSVRWWVLRATTGAVVLWPLTMLTPAQWRGNLTRFPTKVGRENSQRPPSMAWCYRAILRKKKPKQLNIPMPGNLAADQPGAHPPLTGTMAFCISARATLHRKWKAHRGRETTCTPPPWWRWMCAPAS